MKHYSSSRFQEILNEEEFVLVCSASFEKRCLSIPAMAVQSENCRSVLVLRNLENLDNVGEPAANIASSFKGLSEYVDVWGSDPVRTADSMLAATRTLINCPVSRIIVDISAMMRETLLILLASLRELWQFSKRIEFAYVPAEYNRNRKEARPQLSFGILDVRSVIGFPGEYLPVLPRHLILITGFETDRGRAVIQATEPSIISLGVGKRKRSTSEVNAALDKEFAGDLRREYPSQSKVFTVFPDSAEDTANAIHEQISQFNNHKPLVCAMNTKVSTCGAALAAWRDSRIELIYAQPALYNHQDYSDPLDEVYLFDLPELSTRNV